uniref:Uncharacterized protein n=1 Tax=Ananas comosus var. bracteatus TaxID=296719 RepID=A0A6V7Q385_ANACO|nr:unnamed protein product [Ananas comosus var. bracteatus]
MIGIPDKVALVPTIADKMEAVLTIAIGIRIKMASVDWKKNQIIESIWMRIKLIWIRIDQLWIRIRSVWPWCMIGTRSVYKANGEKLSILDIFRRPSTRKTKSTMSANEQTAMLSDLDAQVAALFDDMKTVFD